MRSPAAIRATAPSSAPSRRRTPSSAQVPGARSWAPRFPYSAGSPTRSCTSRARTARCAPSSRTTTSARRPTNRPVSTPAWSSSPGTPHGVTRRAAWSWAIDRWVSMSTVTVSWTQTAAPPAGGPTSRLRRTATATASSCSSTPTSSWLTRREATRVYLRAAGPSSRFPTPRRTSPRAAGRRGRDSTNATSPSTRPQGRRSGCRF